MSVSGPGPGVPNVTLQAMKEIASDTTLELKSEQAAADKSAQAANTQNAFRAKTPKTPKKTKAQWKRIQETLSQAKKRKGIVAPGKIGDKASEFQRKNYELKKEVLILLREQIKPDDTKDAILKKVRETYSDVSLAAEALEFLASTTEGKLLNEVKDAIKEFQNDHDREIKAGRNIQTQAHQAAEKGLGTPTNMRDMYRDITGNPRETNALFRELNDKYSFKEMKKVIHFLLHSMGSDMKAKGPSIPKGELYRLMTEVRSLQALLGVYGFFNKRMVLVESMFARRG